MTVTALRIRAEMVRHGLAPTQNRPWWSPDTESMVDPLDDKVTTRSFLSWLWSEGAT